MSDHGRVAGEPTQTIELGGKTYTLKPFVVGVWAEMSAFVRRLKGDPIKEVCERLASIPTDQQARWMKVAVEAAANQSPTDQELASFETSLLGTAFKLWTTLVGPKAQRDKDILAEFPDAHAVMDRLVSLGEQEGEQKLAEIMMKLDLASGEADLKNSHGQPQTTA